MNTLFKYCIVILVASFCFLASCKSKQKESSSTSTCKALINFRSIGGGIDYKKYDELVNLLSTKKLKFTEKMAGREGEKEICIPLTELKGGEKASFSEQLKTFESTESHISVSIN